MEQLSAEVSAKTKFLVSTKNRKMFFSVDVVVIVVIVVVVVVVVSVVTLMDFETISGTRQPSAVMQVSDKCFI